MARHPGSSGQNCCVAERVSVGLSVLGLCGMLTESLWIKGSLVWGTFLLVRKITNAETTKDKVSVSVDRHGRDRGTGVLSEGAHSPRGTPCTAIFASRLGVPESLLRLLCRSHPLEGEELEPTEQWT